jgi:hypothetical protein
MLKLWEKFGVWEFWWQKNKLPSGLIPNNAKKFV